MWAYPQRGNYFAETSVRARATIAELGARFIRHGSLVLTHGHSRVVLALMRRAVAQARGKDRLRGMHAGRDVGGTAEDGTSTATI